jgi:hypothetical protein
MTYKTWIGGGNNNASNPDDWSPMGAPQSGDELVMPNGGTINITGNALAGNALELGLENAPPALFTINLSQHAQASLVQLARTAFPTTINVSGNDTLHYSSQFPSSPDVTVNLQPHARLTGEFDLTFGKLEVDGGANTRLINNNDDSLFGTHAVITPEVLGIGTFTVGSAQSIAGFLEFGGAVSAGENVVISGDPFRPATSILQVDKPTEFHAAVKLEASAKIDLVGLANADSYTYTNDMLLLWSHNRVIDAMRLTNASEFNGQPHDLVFSKSGSDVWVTENGVNSPPAGSSPLPVHQGALHALTALLSH